MERSDREMVCVQCAQSFKFTAGEQDFYQQNQLQEPRRCKSCRGKRGASQPRDGGGARDRDHNRAPQPSRFDAQRAPQPTMTSHAGYGRAQQPAQNNSPFRRRTAQPQFRPAAADDPNGYRSPGFQDSYQHKIDYAGLPKDDEADDQATMLGYNPTAVARPQAQTARPTRNGHPRGMNGRQPDRSGTDPDAYRSPGFARPQGTPAAQGEGRKSRQQRPRFETTCVECGAPAVVPFQPAEDRPAFCKPCYQIKKPLLGLGPGKTPKTAADESVVTTAVESPVADLAPPSDAAV